MKTKKCSCCNKQLDVIFFNRQSRSPDGLKSWCKPCCNLKERQRSLYNFKSERKVRMIKTFGVEHLMEVEEGRQFKSQKDFIKFKRNRLQEQKDK